jgi:hypothetical protein
MQNKRLIDGADMNVWQGCLHLIRGYRYHSNPPCLPIEPDIDAPISYRKRDITFPTHKGIIRFQFLFASNPCTPDLQPAGLAPNHPIVYIVKP